MILLQYIAPAAVCIAFFFLFNNALKEERRRANDQIERLRSDLLALEYRLSNPKLEEDE